MSILAQEQRSPGGMTFLLPALLLGMITFMLLSSRSQKKREKREREEMHARMAKNDRVLTIGGVVGTVIQVKDNEVVLKVDESTNTKMTFVKTAIQKVITDDQQLSGEKNR
jgi:preprotein translocase subunit YajC